MPLITNSVPNLLGGVSQAPPSLRYPNQCELQENALSSPVDGLTKRPPTEFVAELTETGGASIPDSDGVAIHTINRDTSERYIVSIDNVGGTGTLRVHDIDGTAKTVTIDTGAAAYLNIAGGDDPTEHFDFVTIADVTYIVNKNTGVAFDASVAGYSRQGETGVTADPWLTDDESTEALLWIKNSNFSTKYKVHIGGNLVAFFETPDGTNSDISIGSAELTVLTDTPGDLDDDESITLQGLLPDGEFRIRTYVFKHDELPAVTGEPLGTTDGSGPRGTFDLRFILEGTHEEPTARVNGDVYNIIDSSSTWAAMTVDLLDLDASGATDATSWTGDALDTCLVTDGDQIVWNETDTRWEKFTRTSADDDRIKVGLSGVTTKGGIATQLKNAIMSEKGHNGVLYVRLTNSDDMQAELGEADFINDILTVSQTKSGHEGNTNISEDVDAAHIIIPSQFTGGSVADGVGDEPEDLDAGTIDVAEALAKQLVERSDEVADLDLEVLQSGSVIYIRDTASSPANLNITVEEDDGGDNMQLIKQSVQIFSDLPPVAPDGWICRVDGDLEKDIDNYYVKFNADGTESTDIPLGVGKYVECAKPGVNIQLDPLKMPHILIREASGDFLFKSADGTTPGGGTTYDAFNWHNRLVGDETTNHDPSFVGYKINAINLFKGRLTLLSDENVIMSESGVYWNFFKVTTTSLLDTGPVDVYPSGERVSILRNMVGYNDRLILLSDQTQFALTGSPLVTPKTISITPISDYEALKTCEPIRSATSLFFPFKRGGFSGIRELFVTNGVDLAFNSIDLSEPVPAYIEGLVTQIAGSTHEDIICCITGGNTMYVYNYDNQGKQRTQFAWSKFTFTCTKILSISFIDSVLYMVVKRDEGVFLEKMNLTTGLKDNGSEYVITLDRRTSPSGGSVVYSASTGQTTVTLPYVPEVSPVNPALAINPTILTDNNGYIYTTAAGVGTTMVVEGDLRDVTLFAGEQYTMKYQFTQPTMKYRDQTQGTVERAFGRHQLRYGMISFTDTAYFTVGVTPDYGTTSTYTYTGKILGTDNATLGVDNLALNSGTFRFPIFAKSDRVSITLENNSPLPSKFVAAEFEALFNSRQRRRY